MAAKYEVNRVWDSIQAWRRENQGIKDISDAMGVEGGFTKMKETENIDAAEEVEFIWSLCRKIDELESQLTACQQQACSELRAKIETLEATVGELTVLQLQRQQLPVVCENTESLQN